jgi:PAS domain-containing protein
MGKKARASDRLGTFATEESGFVLRKDTPVQALVRLFMAITVIVAWMAVILYLHTVQGVVLAVGMGTLIFYIGRKLEAQESIQQATEFTNALLASATGDGYRFCAMAKRDGNFVYMNRAFQEAFPAFIEQPKSDLKTLLNLAQIAEADGQTITSLAAEGGRGTVSTNVTMGAEQRSELLTISICAISRPRGFVLIRGK